MRITEQKSYNIQVLRGVAIIAVVFIHNIPSVYVQIWCRPFLNFCVGLFLFLSGMLSYADEKIPWDRIIKVVVPYTIWTFIYVIISNQNLMTIILCNIKCLNHVSVHFLLCAVFFYYSLYLVT